MKRLPLIAIFAFAASCMPLLSSCENQGGSATSYGFDTLWTIDLYEGSQSDCDHIKNLIADVSDSLDPYKSHSPLAKLNANRTIEMNDTLKEALSISTKLQEETKGAFNPFMLELNDAWKQNLAQGKALERDEARSLLDKIAGTCIEFSSDSIRLEGQGSIDLGAIGKGYCMDLIARYLKEKSIKAYRISGGRSSLLLGSSGNAALPAYNIIPEDYPTRSFKAIECGISTSSISQQRYEIDGFTYSHIVNPFTGCARPQYKMALARLKFIDTSPFDFPNSMLDASTTAFFSMDVDEISSYCSQRHLDYIVGGEDGILRNSLGL